MSVLSALIFAESMLSFQLVMNAEDGFMILEPAKMILAVNKKRSRKNVN